MQLFASGPVCLHPSPPPPPPPPGLHWQREKEVQIDKALAASPVDVEALRRHSVSMGGLFHSHLRKRVWPKLVGANVYSIRPYEGAPLVNHKDRAQVLLDVNRCSRRMPARECGAGSEEMKSYS